jgi:phosphoribosyl 1,2-cyclic phosphodiesterase
MFNISILASGSSGNCTAVWTDKAAFLIDCGVSIGRLNSGLAEIGLDINDISACFVTHAHIDHINNSSLKTLTKHKIPVYSSRGVIGDVCAKYGACNAEFKEFDGVKLKNTAISSFKVSHGDSTINETLGFTFEHTVNRRKYKIGYATDTGCVNGEMAQNLKNSNILVLEANYNEDLLEGSYRPRENKRWVCGDTGHLGNTQCAQAIVEIKQASCVSDALKYVMLAHLSAHHNTENVALGEVGGILNAQDVFGIKLIAARRKERTRAIKIV